MKLTVSVVVHQNLVLTQKCIESIFRHTTIPYQLIVTDNASSDGTFEWLSSAMKPGSAEAVSIRRNDKNLGFPEPHNKAFSSTDADVFCVLNNDLEVVPGWAEAMLAEFEKDALVAQVGIKRSCSVLDEYGNGSPTNDAPEYVEASCMMVRAAVVRNLPGGLFDPLYRFAYYEDSDLSLRLKRVGYRVSLVNLPIMHIGSATTKIVKGVDLEGYRLRNKHIFLDRWGSYLKGRVALRITKDRIVVRRAGARGDVIMTVPVVRALRKAYPKAHIVISTVCPEVYDQNPDVSEITLQGTPLRQSDLTFNLDMAYESRPMVHPIQAYADICGVAIEDWTPKLYPTVVARTVALQRLPDGPRYALIHPGIIPGWVGRQWAPLKFTPVVAELRKRGYKTVTIGGEDAPKIGTDLEFRNIPFTHFVALMERASLFLGLDSMPFHVAQACRIPAVGIFGAVDPELRIVPGGQAIGVTAGMGCSGCLHYLPGPKTALTACPRGEDYCMTRLTPEQVIEGIDQVEKLYGPDARR